MNRHLAAALLRLQLGLAVAAGMTLLTAAAHADDNDKSGDEEPKPRPKPKLKAEKVAKPDSEKNDHERVVGHFGVSWFGVSSIPLGIGAPAGNSANPAIALGNPSYVTISAPAIGVRYWLNEGLGIDAGIGIGYSGGSVEDNNVRVGKLGAFGMLFHAGLPLSIVSGKHISLQITPEANFGFAHASVASNVVDHPPPDASLSGMRLDIGARVGGEVQFGFIGLPELALEGSLGAFFTYQRNGVSVGPASHSDVSYSLTTASFHNPWDFFASVVSARYYF